MATVRAQVPQRLSCAVLLLLVAPTARPANTALLLLSSPAKQHCGFISCCLKIKAHSLYRSYLPQLTSGLHFQPCLSFREPYSVSKQVPKHTLCRANSVLCLMIALLSRRLSLLPSAYQSPYSIQVLLSSPQRRDCFLSAPMARVYIAH